MLNACLSLAVELIAIGLVDCTDIIICERAALNGVEVSQDDRHLGV